MCLVAIMLDTMDRGHFDQCRKFCWAALAQLGLPQGLDTIPPQASSISLLSSSWVHVDCWVHELWKYTGKPVFLHSPHRRWLQLGSLYLPTLTLQSHSGYLELSLNPVWSTFIAPL